MRDFARDMQQLLLLLEAESQFNLEGFLIGLLVPAPRQNLSYFACRADDGLHQAISAAQKGSDSEGRAVFAEGLDDLCWVLREESFEK